MQITISRRGVLFATVLVAVGADAGIGWPAILSTDGVISACIDKDGNIKVIDAEAGDSCKKNETPLSWNVPRAARFPKAP